MSSGVGDLFVHVRIVIGMVVGLSVTRLLGGFAKIVQHPSRAGIDPIHLGWALSTLLFVVDFWWWQFGLRSLDHLKVRLFVFVIFYASLFYFLCALLFPDDITDYAGIWDYFMSRRIWFFGILALTNVVDLGDTG